MSQPRTVSAAAREPHRGQRNRLSGRDKGNARPRVHAARRNQVRASTKAHDGVAVNAGQTLNAPDTHALAEGGDDFNLLVAGEDIHGLDPWFWIGPKPDSGKTA